MRIFTRYIWNEVLSHAFLGGALFTFILYMKYVGQLLEMAARNSARSEEHTSELQSQ